MRDFDHPNVMKFLGMCFDAPEGFPYIILPYMANGSLRDYLKSERVRKQNNGHPDVRHYSPEHGTVLRFRSLYIPLYFPYTHSIMSSCSF